MTLVLMDTTVAQAPAEQASDPASPAAGRLAVGAYHSCAVLADGSLRCWGFGGSGQLGLANADNVGDDEVPASVPAVNLGGGHTVKVVAAGDYHTCAILDDGTVRCWGFGGDGRLGYGNTSNVADPSTVGPVDIGAGHTAVAIAAGSAHTCVIRDDGNVVCWGYGGNGQFDDGRLGYGNNDNVGDEETPGSVGTVNLGVGRTAVAISAGRSHTCALLDDGTVRCWGRNTSGQLGYGNTTIVGGATTLNDVTTSSTPDQSGPVQLGEKAVAISAGGDHTCAIVVDGSVRCWGDGGVGQLGYGNRNIIGASGTPDAAGPVDLGPGRTAVAISAGFADTCAILDDGSVRCWGLGTSGRLGYGNTNNVGDTDTPAAAGPVDLGPGRTAIAIAAGFDHTCARLDDGSVRCWGDGIAGELGYCSQDNVGDDATPDTAGPVDLGQSGGGEECSHPTPTPAPALAPSAAVSGVTPVVDPLRVQAARWRALRRCLAAAASLRPRAKRRARSVCLSRFGRTPARVSGVAVRAASGTAVVLSFVATGTAGS
ncbi:MAG: hypothetical protein M3071_15725, partial [Actinomycetota bacterium]|nr:hypothetical protein [Actinomycetota bacterium]